MLVNGKSTTTEQRTTKLHSNIPTYILISEPLEHAKDQLSSSSKDRTGVDRCVAMEQSCLNTNITEVDQNLAYS